MAGVRLPTFENTGGLDVGLGTFRPPSDRGARAIAAGLEDLSGGMAVWAKAEDAKNKKLEAFKAEDDLLKFQANTDRFVEHQYENITPDGKGFFNDNIETIRKSAETTLDQIPEELRPQYEVKMREYLNHTSSKLAQLEINQGRNYIKDVTDKKLTALSNSVVDGVFSPEQATADLDHFLAGADLPPNQTAALRKQGLRTIQLSRLEFLRKNNPQQFVKDALKYLPTAPSQNAGPLQKLAIQQSLQAGIDPRILLTIGTIESGWNANAKAPGSSAYGTYQFTAATLASLGIPPSLIKDPALQTAAMIKLTKQNIAALEANNLDVTPTNVYMMHFLGRNGALAFLNANPNVDAFEVWRSVGGAVSAFDNNGGLLRRGMTVGQVNQAIKNFVAKGERKALSYLEPNENAKGANIPLEIAGEKFDQLTGADVGGFFGKASDEINKATDQTLDGLSKASLLTGTMNPYSSDGRKAIDKATILSGLPEQWSQGGEAEDAQALGLIKQYGYLPKPIAESAMQFIASGNEVQKERAYNLLYAAQAQDPIHGLENSGVNDDIRKRVKAYAAMRSTYDYSPQEAIRYVDRVNTPEYKAKLLPADKDALRSAMSSIGWNDLERVLDLNTWFSGNRTPPEGVKKTMLAMYADRFKFYWRENGDRDLSKALAIDDIKRSHGITSLTPTAVYTMYPPEKYIPEVNGSRKYFTKQLKDFVKEYVTEQSEAVGDPRLKDVDLSTIKIAGTSDTGEDVQFHKMPRYEVFYTDGYGRLQMVPEPFVANPALAAGKYDFGTAASKQVQQTTNNKHSKPSVDIAARRKARDKQEREDAFKALSGLNPTF